MLRWSRYKTNLVRRAFTPQSTSDQRVQLVATGIDFDFVICRARFSQFPCSHAVMRRSRSAFDHDFKCPGIMEILNCRNDLHTIAVVSTIPTLSMSTILAGRGRSCSCLEIRPQGKRRTRANPPHSNTLRVHGCDNPKRSKSLLKSSFIQDETLTMSAAKRNRLQRWLLLLKSALLAAKLSIITKNNPSLDVRNEKTAQIKMVRHLNIPPPLQSPLRPTSWRGH